MERNEAHPYVVNTLQKASRIFDQFLRNQGASMTIAEMAKSVNINRTTVWRLVLSLEELGFLQRTSDGERFRLGVKMLQLGTVAQGHINLRKVCHPVMQRLAAVTQESVYLSIRSENRRVCLDLVESTLPIRHKIDLGEVTPLYAGAASKLLLASMGREMWQKYLREAEFQRYTTNTIVDPVLLQVELEKTRREGWAFSSGERFTGTSSVAVPVRDHLGNVIASLSIAGPDARMEATGIDALIRLVKEAGDELSALLGFSGEVSWPD